jgi:hypothetical protein
MKNNLRIFGSEVEKEYHNMLKEGRKTFYVEVDEPPWEDPSLTRLKPILAKR